MVTAFQNKTVSFTALSVLLIFLTAFLDFNNSSAALTFPFSGYLIKTIVIDPGHGGKDPGCLGKYTREKDIALSIAQKLGANIQAEFPEIKVIFTRETDVFIPLHERAAIANRNQADLFMSIHCNTVARRNQAQGSETYVMGLHRAKENLDVAKRENAVILQEENYDKHYHGYDPNSPEGHIILSMFQNAFLEQSILLAGQIEDQFEQIPDKKSRGVKQAGFLVLRQTTMPSVLIETGFLSHDHEEKHLSEAEHQSVIAESIFNAFKAYKNLVEDTTPHFAGETPAENSNGTHQKIEISTPIQFKIQVAASTVILNTSDGIWENLPNVETKRENNYYKYLVGPFEELEKATEVQKNLKDQGFPEAFLVAYRGESRIPIQDAMTMLQEK